MFCVKVYVMRIACLLFLFHEFILEMCDCFWFFFLFFSIVGCLSDILRVHIVCSCSALYVLCLVIMQNITKYKVERDI